MKTLVLEVRDRMTFLPVLAIITEPVGVVEQFYLAHCCGHPRDGVIFMRLDDQTAHADPSDWKDRTLSTAHNYVLEHFRQLKDGDVIDVEFILGETAVSKISERNGG